MKRIQNVSRMKRLLPASVQLIKPFCLTSKLDSCIHNGRFARTYYNHEDDKSAGESSKTKEAMIKNKRKLKSSKLHSEVEIKGEIIFGVHPVHLALISQRRKVHCLYIKERHYVKPVKQIMEIATALDLKRKYVTNYTLETLSGKRPHQGVCLDVSPVSTPELKFEEDTPRLWSESGKNKHPIWLLPYKVKDPMNMGAILRTSYYLGVDQVILPKKDSSALSGTVSKASSGALEVLEIKSLKNHTALTQFIQSWKAHGGKVVGTSGDSDNVDVIPVSDYVIDSPTLVIVGNEEKGIRDDILDLCDLNITVKSAAELHPLISSLNVSVATGILIHSLISKRNSINSET